MKSENRHTAQAWIDLGDRYRQQGSMNRGLSLYRQAADQKPNSVLAIFKTALALQQAGEPDEAAEAYRQALILDPSLAQAWNNLGGILKESGAYEEALACFRRAVSLNPELPQAHFNLGYLFEKAGRVAEALSSYEKALSLEPDSVKINSQLVFLMQASCTWRSIDKFAERLDAMTRRNMAAGGSVSETPFKNIARQMDPAANFAIARSLSGYISEKVASLRKSYTFKDSRLKRTKIRVGYLSNDFRDHPIAHLILGLFGCHNRDKFEIFCYSHGPNDESFYRSRIQNDCDKFIDLMNYSDADAADKIYEDQVDLLVDLMGYTQGHRLAISALRPAPVQVSFLGFPGTTGANFFDYIIADRTVIPKTHQPFYSEKIAYMPHCYQVNDHKQAITAHRPSVTAHGLPENGFVFCAFHQSFKIDPIMYNTWMKILAQVPGSVLWLLQTNSYTENNLKMSAKERGIDPQRLVFGPRMPKEQHLGRHCMADLMLDTRIYNGHTTTSDALWAGVPVIAMMGNHFASRVSASILSAIGLSELITHTLEEYEKLAVRLALDPAKLNILKKTIANNQATHPLFDTRRYVRNLENAFIQMWLIYAAGQNPRHIEVRED